MGRAKWIYLGICWVLIALPLAAADGNATAFPDVMVDLSGRLFDQTLPFDVPFTIHGAVPADTVTVKVDYIGHRRPFTVDECDRGAPPSCQPTCTEDSDGVFACRWQPPGGAILWRRELPPPSGDTVTFRVPVPPLDASSYYSVRFRIEGPLSDEALQAFQTRAQAALGELLAEIPNDDATTADNERLRQVMVRELQAVSGPGLQIAGETLFDLAVAYDDLPDSAVLDFNQLVGDVLQAQGRVKSNLIQRSLQQPQLEANLATIAGSASLDELIRALRAEGAPPTPTATSGLIQELMSRHADALALADLTADERANLALGLAADATDPKPTLTEDATPATATTFTAGYRQTTSRLRQLQEWLRSLVTGGNRGLLDQAVAASDTLTDQNVTHLQSLLGTLDAARQRSFALANFASQVGTALEARATAVASLSQTVRARARSSAIQVNASTVSSFKTQQKWYISADFGFAYGPDVDKVVPYVGTNIYLQPVNKNAPLSVRGGFLRRFAFTLGLTVKSLADSSPQTRSDLWDSNSLLVGVGYRITDSGRLGVGALVFNEQDPNPLIDEESVTVSPYLSLSFDVDVLSFFKQFSGLFPNT